MKIKDQTKPVPQQLQEIVIDRIQQGYYPPQKRIGSIRKVSREFSISKWSVIEAFKSLETQGYVTIVPSKGVFVSTEPFKKIDALDIYLFSPVNAFSTEFLDSENYAINTEIYRGIVEKLRTVGGNVHYFYCDPSADIEKAIEEIKSLPKIDAALFITEDLNLIRNRLCEQNIPMLHIMCDRGVESPCPYLLNDIDKNTEALAEYIANKGYTQFGFIRSAPKHTNCKYKIDRFREHATEKGLTFIENGDYILPAENADDAYERLCQMLPSQKEQLPPLFFSDRTFLVSAFFRICAERGWKIGTDVAIAGYASKFSFKDMTPKVTHFEVENYKLGFCAAENLIEHITEKLTVNEIQIMAGKVVAGYSA